VVAFDDFVNSMDYPIFIVTTQSPVSGERAGCVVGFASQTSITPRRFLIGISRKNFTYQIACNATHLAVHLLPRSRLKIVRLFGEYTGDDIDKFSQCQWQDGPAAVPILAASPAWFVGAITERLDLGDHVGFLLEPIAGSVNDQLADWTSFADVRDLTAGHEA
jgi:flavin reductase (DIM6/NTAB) family NADH-FMN oxidoreductase RutF